MVKVERMVVHGCDFAWRASPKGGFAVFVRKVTESFEAERAFIGRKRTSKNAESFAMDWAHREAIRKKTGQPSQLRRKAIERVRVIEEE